MAKTETTETERTEVREETQSLPQSPIERILEDPKTVEKTEVTETETETETVETVEK